VLVDGDEARGAGSGEKEVAFVDAVAGDDVDEVADDDGRGGGEVVREDAEFLHHVELPDDVLVDLDRSASRR
jgi:hypothetical protein